MTIYFKTVGIYLLTLTLTGSLQAQSPKTLRTDSIYRLTEIIDSFGRVVYHHNFEYDKQGRPSIHKYDYFLNGNLHSSANLQYIYDASGKLILKNSDVLHYKYFYNKNGTLIKITLEILVNKKWQLCEETVLEEKENPFSNKKLLRFQLNKRKAGKSDSLMNYSTIDYTMDKSSNILAAKVYTYRYVALKEPASYSYYYDNKPNPVQNIFLERWYEFDLENGGLTNVLTKKREDSSILG